MRKLAGYILLGISLLWLSGSFMALVFLSSMQHARYYNPWDFIRESAVMTALFINFATIFISLVFILKEDQPVTAETATIEVAEAAIEEKLQ